MTLDGIALAALYPTYGLMIQGVTERAPALALCRAVNDWLAEYCDHDRDRLLGIGTLPMTDAGDALGEARRCVEELGFRGVWRRPEHFGSLPHVYDDAYEPLWSYLEEANVAFGVHPGIAGLVPYEQLRSHYGDYFTPLHATHFILEHLLAITTFVAYGILERHPGLRVAFLESGRGVGARLSPPPRRAPGAVRLRPGRPHPDPLRVLPPPVLPLRSRTPSPAWPASSTSTRSASCSPPTIRTPTGPSPARPGRCSSPTSSTTRPAGGCCATTPAASTGSTRPDPADAGPAQPGSGYEASVTRRQPPAAQVPPSTWTVVPVTNRARSLARNTTTAAASSGWPSAPTGGTTVGS